MNDMPLGIISDDEFNSEISNSGVLDNGIIVNTPPKGRGEGNTEVPESLRKIIGEESNLTSRPDALAIAKEFGISPSSTSAYANGTNSTSTYNTPVEELTNHINKAKLKASKRASGKLLNALSHITDEKLSNAKVADLAVVAKAMSGIVKDMEPETKNSGIKDGNTFIFYAPRPLSENSLPVIEVRE